MRIFHVSDCFAPRTGGIESQVRDLARAQSAAGHEVHVLTATPGPRGERGGASHDDDGVVVHRLGTRVPFDLPVNPAAPPRVRELLRSWRPDVVHVHAGVVSPFAFDGARVALAEAAPLAVTWHCMLDGVVPVLRAAARRTGWATAPVALSAVSSAAAERVAEVFGAPVEVVPNGIDLEGWAPSVPPSPPSPPPLAPRALSLPAPRTPDRPVSAPAARPGPVLRCVATMRLAPRKRGPALVDLMCDVTDQLESGEVTLDVIGDGPARATMQRRVDRRGLADVVRLRGRLPREEVRRAYDDADVFLAPAVLEAFGIAALEARTAGLVVVGRRGTGLSEFVTHGLDGVLVDDDAGMARAVVRLARDPRRLEWLRRHARDGVPPFGWSQTVAAAMAEYERARTLRAAADTPGLVVGRSPAR